MHRPLELPPALATLLPSTAPNSCPACRAQLAARIAQFSAPVVAKAKECVLVAQARWGALGCCFLSWALL